MQNIKKLALIVILDAYVTKNAIEGFLISDHTEYLKNLSSKYKKQYREEKINSFIEYLRKELKDINEFLDDKDNIYLVILNKNREFFDKSLPKHKRRIEWFRSVDRYPFDYNIFIGDDS